MNKRSINADIYSNKSLNVVDSPELRNLLLYIGAGVGLLENDIPHRDKLKNLINRYMSKKYKEMIEDIQVSAQRVQFQVQFA